MAFQKTKGRVSLLTAILVFACFALANCGKQAGGPPSIRYGKDLCDECRMIINEDRFAAAATGPSGQAAKFDSVGCLLRYRQSRPELEKIWVKSYGTAEWLDATAAFFVFSEQISAPMGYGLAAEATKSAAQKLADEVHGRIFDFAELISNSKKPELIDKRGE